MSRMLFYTFYACTPFQALHAAQKKLQEEEDELRDATKELEEATRKRKKLEVKNAKASKELEQELVALRKTRQKQDRLREEYNALLARVISSEARRDLIQMKKFCSSFGWKNCLSFGLILLTLRKAETWYVVKNMS